ncbi:MAG TPA: sulfite exporter TauE/SafE family protein [Chloroflexota bacterium]|nr:sulfite exporter TauE/SafE family protein [Chloroflexota bacterium]
MDFRFTLIGLIIGFLIGLTGMGGGSLMTPVMILVMGVKPLVAVGTDLAYGAVTRIVGGAQHLRQNTVHRKTAYLLALGSVPSTFLGVGLITNIKQSHPALVSGFVVHAIAWALIVVAAVLVAKPLITRRLTNPDWREDLLAWGDRVPWVLPIIGALVGFLVGLTSVGAGTLIVLALLFLYPRWESKDLVGTDVFHAALLVSAASIAQFAVGNVNVPMMLSLLLGSVPGVLLGSRLAIGFPEQMLRLSMASIMLISGAKLL